jgi:hypothetical protein
VRVSIRIGTEREEGKRFRADSGRAGRRRIRPFVSFAIVRVRRKGPEAPATYQSIREKYSSYFAASNQSARKYWFWGLVYVLAVLALDTLRILAPGPGYTAAARCRQRQPVALQSGLKVRCNAAWPR